MKKNSIKIIVFIIVCLLLFLLFQYRDENKKLKNVYVDGVNQLYDLKDKKIQKEFKIDISSLEEYHVSFSILNISCERIMMFKIKEGQTKDIINKVNRYISNLEKVENIKREKMILNKVEMFQKNQYYFVVISENASPIMEEIKKKVL